MTGIPTKYAGVLFRSRLEARWAAMFDLMGWRWEYEPFDLDGYIPDFGMVGWKKPFIVEVKPALSVGTLRTHTGKIERSGWTGDALLLGASPKLSDQAYDTFGLVSQRDATGTWDWEDAVVDGDGGMRNDGRTDTHEDRTCNSFCVFHVNGFWTCYRCGVYCKWITTDLSELWKQAIHKVRYERGDVR